MKKGLLAAIFFIIKTTLCYGQDLYNAGGYPCYQNIFWAVTNSGNIEEFVLNGGTVTSNGIIITGMVEKSLAFSNNLNDSILTPTFYSIGPNRMNVAYYNGLGWSYPFGIDNSTEIFNAGGYQNYLYYLGNINTTLLRYNGHSFDSIYQNNNIFRCADLAVDDSGNVWGLTGITFNENFIDVISPGGQLIKRYYTQLDNTNCYGCFLLNDVLYFGFGLTAAPFHTHKLIPYTFTLDSAIQGTPVEMPDSTYADLASCAPGNPIRHALLMDVKNISQNILRLSPNPFTSTLSISLQKENLQQANLTITDVMGSIVFKSAIQNSPFEINLSYLPAGVYFLQVIADGERSVRQLVKQ